MSITQSPYKTVFTLLALSLPSLAMAHPNHLETHSFAEALQLGFVHPFTGADHMMLAVGMGMLMYRYRQSVFGLSSLSVGLLIGFCLAVTGTLSTAMEKWAEYGILASVLIVAISLFNQKYHPTNRLLSMLGLTLLATFHGMAHGLEVPNPNLAEGFFIGMLLSMTTLFGIGTYLMKSIQQQFGDNHWVQKVLAVLGLVAVALN